MAEEPVFINNEKFSDQRFDPNWKFRQTLRIGEHEQMPNRNSLDYSSRTFRGFNDTQASIFQSSKFEFPTNSVRNSLNHTKTENMRQSFMNFGSNSKMDFERIQKNVKDNTLRDTKPSLRTLVGNDEKVMNLRPLQKDKHMDEKLFCHGMKTDYEKMQYKNMGSPNKYYCNN